MLLGLPSVQHSKMSAHHLLLPVPRPPQGRRRTEIPRFQAWLQEPTLETRDVLLGLYCRTTLNGIKRNIFTAKQIPPLFYPIHNSSCHLLPVMAAALTPARSRGAAGGCWAGILPCQGLHG